MAIYLVDMENIPHAWGKLLDACADGDRFVLFYTEQVTQVPITLMEKVTASPAAMEYVRCRGGANGLDFQLVTEMGYRVAKDPSAEYIIVSQDHGFDVVIDYWSERGVRTRRMVPSVAGQAGAISEYSAGGEGEPQEFDFSDPQSVKEFLSWKLSNKVRKTEIPFIVDILMDAMVQGGDYPCDKRLSYRFTYLDKALRGKYGDAKGPKLRDQIKAVSKEAFSLSLRTEAGEVPKEAGAEGPEELVDAVYARLAGLGIAASRAREIAGIVSEVLRSGEEHQRAAIYRRILSTFGRKDGVELYRAAKDSVGQFLLEQAEYGQDG